MQHAQHLNEIERAILIGAAGDLERNSKLGWPEGRTGDAVRIGAAKIDADYGLVAVNAARWLGCSTTEDPALRMAISRAYNSLQRRELLTRVAGGYSDRRSTHLRLTDAGKALAASLSNASQRSVVSDRLPGSSQAGHAESPSGGTQTQGASDG